MSDLEVNTKLTADASGLVAQAAAGAKGVDGVAEATQRATAATRTANEESARFVDAQKGQTSATRGTTDETRRLEEGQRNQAQSSRAAAEESRRFVERLKDEAATLGMTKAETEAYTASQLRLTEAQKASVAQSLKLIQAHEAGAQGMQRLNSQSVEFIKGLVGYEALSRAAGTIKEYAQEAAMLATRYETLGVVMPVVGRNAGYTAGQMEMSAEGVRKMGITMVESRESVIKMAQANIDLSLATRLARVAQDAAVIGNTNSSEALSRLIHGVQSAQTDVLRTIGINVNFEESYKRLSTEMGKTTEQLTEAEKAQSRANTVLDAGTRIAGTYEAAMGTAGKQMSSMARYAEDLKVLRGQIFNEALVIAVNNYTDSLKGADSQARKLAEDKAFKEWGRDMIRTFAYVGDVVVGAWDAISQGVESSGVVILQTLNAITKVQTWTPVGWAANKAAGDPAGKMDAFTDAFTLRANERLQTRLNRPQLRDSAEAFFAQQDRDAAAAARRQIENDFYGVGNVNISPPAPAAKGKLSEFDRLYKQQIEHAAVLEAQRAGTEKLTASEQLREKVLAGVDEGLRKMTPAQRNQVMAVIEGNIAIEKEIVERERAKKASEAATKELERLTKGRFQEVEAERKQLSAVEDQNKKFKEQVEQIGLTSEQLGLLKIQRAEAALASAEEAEQTALLSETYEGNIDLVKARTRAAREYLDLTKQGTAREAAADQSRIFLEDQKRNADNIERGLVDAIFRGFDKGKSFARNFWDSLASMAKTAVLQPIIAPIVRPFAQAIGGAISGITSGLGFSSAGGVGSGLSLANGANTVSGWFGGPSLGPGSLSQFWTGGIAGMGAATGGATLSTMSGAALADISLGGLGGSAAAAELAAGAGGLGSALAAIPGWGWALGAGALLLGSDLLGDGGGPKASEAWLQGGPGSFNIGINNAAGGDPDMAQVRALNALLQDPTKYDQGVLASLAGTSINTGAPADTATLISKLTAALQPAADAAQAEATKTATKAAQTAAVAAQQRQLDISLMEAQGDAAGALAARRKAELEAMDESLRGVAQQIYAAQDLAQARQEEAAKATRLATALQSIASTGQSLQSAVSSLPNQLGINTLLEAQRSLAISEFVAPGDRVAAAKSQVDALYASAIGGDLAAVQAFPQQLQASIAVVRDSFASGPQFQEFFVDSNRKLNDLLGRQQSLQAELLRDVPATIQQASIDQIGALRVGFSSLVSQLELLRVEVRQLAEAA